jgi:hypothetical protein
MAIFCSPILLMRPELRWEGKSRLPHARAQRGEYSRICRRAGRGRRRRLLRGETRIGCGAEGSAEANPRRGKGEPERRLEEFAGVSNPNRGRTGTDAEAGLGRLRLHGPGSSWAVVDLSKSFFFSFLSLSFF